MAGYVISLNNKDSLSRCFDMGTYGTAISEPANHKYWRGPHEGTFADYLSMKKGDFIFFFIARKLYGIGELVNLKIDRNTSDCKFLNYHNSDIPKKQNRIPKKYLLDDIKIDQNNKEQLLRMICIFKPSVSFFEDGVDMDDVLESNPSCFRMLRAFWKVSFIKIDDIESECLVEILLRRLNGSSVRNSTYVKYHKEIRKKLNNDYYFSAKNILKFSSDGDKIKHEMAVEAALIFQLSNVDSFKNTEDVFGKWDYISHQVIASPFKPIDYMDKMDIFGYSYLASKSQIKIKDKHYVIELKKGSATKADVDQSLKYVDWLKSEYTGQDYSVITAYLVAYTIPNAVREHMETYANRTYQIGKRPIRNELWKKFKLVEYKYNTITERLDFIDVTPT